MPMPRSKQSPAGACIGAGHLPFHGANCKSYQHLCLPALRQHQSTKQAMASALNVMDGYRPQAQGCVSRKYVVATCPEPMFVPQAVAYGLFVTPLYFMWEKLIHTHRRPLWIRLPSRIPVVLLIWFMCALLHPVIEMERICNWRACTALRKPISARMHWCSKPYVVCESQ